MKFPRIPSLVFTTVAVFVGITCIAVGSLAQERPGAIGGTVIDPSGAVLHGAQISLQSPVINVASDEQGRFIINNLPPGE